MILSSAWRVCRDAGRLATGGARLLVDALVIAGPWVWIPGAVVVAAWIAGFPVILALVGIGVLLVVAAADTGDRPSAGNVTRSLALEAENMRHRARARMIRREWPRMCERAGWLTPQDLEKRRPVPRLRLVRQLGARLFVSWRPPEDVQPREWPAHVEALRRVLGAHAADWRPVTGDPGTLVAAFGMQELPQHQDRAPDSAPPAAGQGPAFPLGVGAGGSEVVWRPFQAPHMLVTGTTGGGKGSVLRGLTADAAAAGWEVTVIDGKQAGEYRWVEDHGGQVLRDGVQQAADALAVVEEELQEVGRVLWQHGVETVHQVPEELRPDLRLVVVDEAADLLLLRRGPAEKDADGWRAVFGARLNRVIAQGRACGIHVVIALQRPDAQILSGFMRNNLAARLVVGHIDPDGADMVFGHDGADAAAGYLDGTPGRAVAVGLTRGHTAPAPLQVAYVSASDLRRSA